ncbi:MAG: hypothetical protein WA823_06660 [Candidatus Acidiferrales bacterium]
MTKQYESTKVEIVVELIVTPEVKEHAIRRNQLHSIHRTIVSREIGEVDAGDLVE